MLAVHHAIHDDCGVFDLEQHPIVANAKSVLGRKVCETFNNSCQAIFQFAESEFHVRALFQAKSDSLLEAIVDEHGWRYDLDGNPAERVSPQQMMTASNLLLTQATA